MPEKMFCDALSEPANEASADAHAISTLPYGRRSIGVRLIAEF
jgi:hypothetical protein